jgi:hypothetical protein
MWFGRSYPEAEGSTFVRNVSAFYHITRRYTPETYDPNTSILFKELHPLV